MSLGSSGSRSSEPRLRAVKSQRSNYLSKLWHAEVVINARKGFRDDASKLNFFNVSFFIHHVQRCLERTGCYLKHLEDKFMAPFCSACLL